ncbi:MAG: type I DNA topoisomerase [Candidatus Kapaibacterium sp.]
MAIKNLVIVESPAKAKTIEKYLGGDFIVRSCQGHIRDLVKGDAAIDIKNGFTPLYEVSDEKKHLVSELKKLANQAETVWLASDEDREGEAISWHLFEALKLKKDSTRRIVFNEITKTAILKAIANPRGIDENLVNAQQARRILDRLVGFEVSPVLWRKIQRGLSAGRVQSVAVRLIVEREKEIRAFESSSTFRITAEFDAGNGKVLTAELPKKFETEQDARAFLERCINANFTIGNLETKPAKKSPSPPFTTSTLQQEASRKLGFSIAQTMLIAQKLYEGGLITYMRTDSVNLSEDALSAAKSAITNMYGGEYSNTRQYTTKSFNAQEAHEAIRPTDFTVQAVDGDYGAQRLYDLIWKRSVASQMADAQLEKTVATINISTTPENLVATGEVLKFDGFLKAYMESSDDETDSEDSKKMLPPLNVGQNLPLQQMNATEKFSRPSARYTEATLVKRLEELGIGRPSTYAPTISTIQKRGYVVKEDREGRVREYKLFTLVQNSISLEKKTENYGAEKSKLFPTDIGILVTDFLINHFTTILDYSFTANVEEKFDEIATGKIEWHSMLGEFYAPFHDTVVNTLGTAERATGERMIGVDPSTGKNMYARMGRYGAYVQIGENDDETKKYANIKGSLSIETITVDEALTLFRLPRIVGEYEDKELKVAVGRFGPYVQHGSLFASLTKEDDPYTIDQARAIELVEKKRQAEIERNIKLFPENPDVKILKGRWGPFLAIGKNNYKLPKGTDPKELSLEDCLQIAAQDKQSQPLPTAAAKAPAKKAAAKKTLAKKAAKKATTK